MTVVKKMAILLAAVALVAAGGWRVLGAGNVNVVVHYQRDAGEYARWSLWLWPAGGDGSAHEFNGSDDFGAVCETSVAVASGASEIGIIARLGDWEAKDIDKDRFLALDKVKDGVLECWLVQDDENIYYDRADIPSSRKIKSAVITDMREITFTLGADLGADAEVHVTSGDAAFEVEKVEMTGRKGVITLKGDIDLGKRHKVKINDAEGGFEDKDAAATTVFGSAAFEEKYGYKGDLGAVYSAGSTTFTVWAPTAEAVSLVFYADGYEGKLTSETAMARVENGAWRLDVSGDLNGQYYNYRVTVNGDAKIAVDPYAKATGVNGLRGMVIDTVAASPTGWENDNHFYVDHQTDAVLYELHVRDFSVDKNSGLENKGKFLAFTELDTKFGDYSTGISYIKELGVTHIHLLPSFDFHTIDETKPQKNEFNWGYDPQNYNVPEGSYSTDPYDGAVRVKEFKEMVQSVHNQGMGVVMDVVYNHTYEASGSLFDKIVPGYYYRTDENGRFSNGSGCGNETASERVMMRRYILDSVYYWATEYHVDGFRFDIMALHDVETMNAVRELLDTIDPRILIYGEGWQAGSSPLKGSNATLKQNAALVSDRIAFFSDDFRDAIKGNVFDKSLTGFASGNNTNNVVETLKFGIVGDIEHPQVRGVLTNAGKAWAKQPTQALTYASCHDNYALWDKLYISTKLDPVKDKDALIAMNKLSAAALFTSQGMAFFQAGEEFGRTKGGDENSYKSPDSVNRLDWERRVEFNDLVSYYQGLIKLRKEHPAFRMFDADEIREKLTFLDIDNKTGVIGYTINGNANGDKWEKIAVLMNNTSAGFMVQLPSSGWVLVANGGAAGVEKLGYMAGDTVVVPARTAYVFADGASFGYAAATDEGFSPIPEPEIENCVLPTSDNTDNTETGDNVEEKGILDKIPVWGVVTGAVVLLTGVLLLVSFVRKGNDGKRD